MPPLPPTLPRNDLKKRTYRLFNTADAIASQHGNLTNAKVKIAVEQAFSLWSAVAQLNFVADPDGTGAPDVPITFSHFGESDAQLGNGTVEINIDQDFFVDPFAETDPRPVRIGPFDLVRTLAHEIGHKLGLDHPPAGHDGPALMSPSFADKVVLRELFPFDVAEIQQRFGAIQLSGEVAAPLEGAVLVDGSAGIIFNASPGAVVVGGPDRASCVVDAFVPIQAALLNNVKVRYTIVSRNAIVGSLELWDGLVLLQTYSLASSASSNEGLRGRTFDHNLGVVARRTMQHQLRVRFEMAFREVDRGVNGVVIIEAIRAGLLPQLPVLDPA